MLSPYSVVSTGYTHQSVPLCCLLIVLSARATRISQYLYVVSLWCCQHGLYTSVSTSMLSPYSVVSTGYTHQSVPLCCLLMVLSARAIHISQYLYVVSLWCCQHGLYTSVSTSMLSPYSVVSTGYTHQSVPLCCLLIVLSARATHISQYLYVVSL